MIAALFAIIKVFLGFGIAGILIVIGLFAAATWLVKSIIVRVYYAIHHYKGGDK